MVGIKIVKAQDNSIAAGGNVTIINVTLDGSRGESVADVFGQVGKKLRANETIGRQISNAATSDQIAGGMALLSQSDPEQDQYEAAFGRYTQGITAVHAGRRALDKREFALAHACLGEALQVKWDDVAMRLLVKDFVTSGYVLFSLTSDVTALRALVGRCMSEFATILDLPLRLLIAEAHQEIATRQIANDMLLENKALLESLFEEASPGNLRATILLGLLNRRLAERDDYDVTDRLTLLREACAFFKAASESLGQAVSAEVQNNWAIASIRLYELTKDRSHLETAESVLDSIDYAPDALPLADFLALPKSHNNRGNIQKQRLRHEPDPHFYAEAIESYTKAEAFWDEAGSPYEWAMVQKNKAETRLAYMEAFGANAKIAKTAHEEITRSMSYRNPTSAPYQHARSTDVLNRLENLISSL